MAREYDSAPEVGSAAKAVTFPDSPEAANDLFTSLQDLHLHLIHKKNNEQANMDLYGKRGMTPIPQTCSSPRAQRLAHRKREHSLHDAHTSDTANSLTLEPNIPRNVSQSDLSTSTSIDEKKRLKAWLVEHQHARTNMHEHDSNESLYDDTTTSEDVKQARALRRAIQSLQTWQRLEAHELRATISCLGEKQVELQQAELRCLRRIDNLVYNTIGKRTFRWIVALLLCLIVLLLCITVMLFWIVSFRAV